MTITDTWVLDAACRRVDPDTMYPDPTDDEGIAIARRICGHCVVIDHCRNLMTGLSPEHGVWAGTTEADRAEGHGTTACYKRGCRDPRCVNAWHAYQREWKERRRARDKAAA